MEQFSHDLTLALEETSRFGENRNRWGLRRRTRSTGNLPCAPQPTEDSSSSPADHHEFNTSQNSPQLSGNNIFQSDSDDKHSLAFAFRSRQTPLTGNFESDSFNENFSPARPNLRRKRKFKRMAVGYEASLSSSSVANSSIFPAILKKRAFNHENLRANLFFCGKRKRGHRDRYVDYESHKQHSNSVPRQRDLFAPKSLSYLECKGRNRAASFTSGVSFNKNIISKIEKLSHERNLKLCFQFSTPFNKKIDLPDGSNEESNTKQEQIYYPISNIPRTSSIPAENAHLQNPSDKAETCRTHSILGTGVRKISGPESASTCQLRASSNKHHSKSHKVKHSRRHEQMQLQYDDRMNCPNMSELLSSSSLSSSDSEAINTNESDHEGDDELTDWPGNEGMINFTSKNDFKKQNKIRVMKPSLPQIKQQDDIQDDDTLMSTDDSVVRPLGFELATLAAHNNLTNTKCSPGSSEDLPLNKSTTTTFSIQHMSASSSNCQPWLVKTDDVANTLFTPPNIYTEIREIRAGCRRIREERPGFSIISSANELLSRFLQNDQQQVLTLFDINATEYDKLHGLSKMYSLTMQVENGCVILNKTSNTMQSIRIDQTKLPKNFCDFKRRCYGDSVDVDFNDLRN